MNTILDNRMLTFQPHKIFDSNGDPYLFDGGTLSLYRIDDTVLKILQHQNESAKDAYSLLCNDIEEGVYWDTLSKMKESGFIVEPNNNKKSCADSIPYVRGVTLMLIQACNLACEYCFGSEGEYADRGIMPEEIALKAIDYLVENSGDVSDLNVTFFGGEPLLCFELIKKIVRYCKNKEMENGKKFQFSMTTNGTLLNDEINEFIINNRISSMISIDGDRTQQNAKRYYKSGQGSYDEIVEKTEHLRNEGCLSARATITVSNIDLQNVFDHLESLGFTTIPMSPAYNLLSENEHKQYLAQLDRLCEYFSILLRNDLEKAKKVQMLWKSIKRVHKGAGQHSACGAGANGIAVDIHGNIYPCHRFVSHKQFVLGNIHNQDNSRKEYLAEANLENHGKCEVCYLRLLCGGGCPYENYVETGDIKNIYERQCMEIKVIYSNIISIYLSLTEEEKKEIFK